VTAPEHWRPPASPHPVTPPPQPGQWPPATPQQLSPYHPQDGSTAPGAIQGYTYGYGQPGYPAPPGPPYPPQITVSPNINVVAAPSMHQGVAIGTGRYRRTSHGFHLVMTVLTGGLWGLCVWLPLVIARRRHS
jgi:hypothetical protein